MAKLDLVAKTPPSALLFLRGNMISEIWRACAETKATQMVPRGMTALQHRTVRLETHSRCVHEPSPESGDIAGGKTAPVL